MMQSFRSLNVGETDERIMTEIDCSEQRTSKHLAGRGNVASQAVFTDYDIADEVPPTGKPPEFIMRNTIDTIKVDRNIEDLTRKRNSDAQYWTALQSSTKDDVYDLSVKQASQVRETEEKDSSDGDVP